VDSVEGRPLPAGLGTGHDQDAVGQTAQHQSIAD
jgi:hypothetical protein